MRDFYYHEVNEKRCELIYEFNVPCCNDTIIASLDEKKTLLTIIGKQASVKAWISQVFMKFAFSVCLLLPKNLGDQLARIANCVVAHDLDNDSYILMKSTMMLYVDSANSLKNRFNMKIRLAENIIKNGDREVTLSIDKLRSGLEDFEFPDDVVNNAIVQKSTL